MAKRKQRTVYVTKEPDWKKFRGITDPEQQEKAFRSVDYFVHSEISTKDAVAKYRKWVKDCLLYTSPSPRDGLLSRMPSSA